MEEKIELVADECFKKIRDNFKGNSRLMGAVVTLLNAKLSASYTVEFYEKHQKL